MSNISRKRTIHNTLAMGDTAGALELLLEYVGLNSSQYEDVIMLKGRFNQLNKDKIKGIITADEYSRANNSIVLGILSITNDIHDEQIMGTEELAQNAQSYFTQKDEQAFLDKLIGLVDEKDLVLKNSAIVTKSDFLEVTNRIQSFPVEKTAKLQSELNQKLLSQLLTSIEQSETRVVNTTLIKTLLNDINAQLLKVKAEIQQMLDKAPDHNVSMTIKILVIHSNPENLHGIAFGKEAKIVSDTLKRGKNRAKYELLPPVGAVKYDEIKTIIAHSNADIVHISVHGSKDKGLIFEDDNGLEVALNVKQMRMTFEQALKKKDPIKCVFFSACNSMNFAEELKEKGLCTFSIGMNDYIPDDAALAYTQGFYETLFDTDSFEDAHEDGVYKIALKDFQVPGYEDKAWEEVPVLFSNT